MITKNKMVSVSYELRTEQNGELLEAAGADRPLDFICGQGQTLEYFEMNLLDKNEGINSISAFRQPMLMDW